MNPLRGFPGHPSHPPLTDVTVGAYTFATIAVILSKAGVADHAFAQAWWLALVVGVFFVLAIIFGHDDYTGGAIPNGSLVLTCVAFVLLVAGGTMGGSITYVHGMRVLDLIDEPTSRAITPGMHEEKKEASA